MHLTREAFPDASNSSGYFASLIGALNALTPEDVAFIATEPIELVSQRFSSQVLPGSLSRFLAIKA